MGTFRDNSKAYLEEIRNVRFAMVTETNSMTRELRDLRRFFLDADHKEEITRLREFVGLCERLRELKKDGTLDAVAETILRLSGA